MAVANTPFAFPNTCNVNAFVIFVTKKFSKFTKNAHILTERNNVTTIMIITKSENEDNKININNEY